VPPVEFSHAAPPPELVRFGPRASSPQWTGEDFAAWLRARAAWRDTQSEPLPSLVGRERIALSNLVLPAALVEAERNAGRQVPQ
jgi:hypothetical protein